MSKISLEHIKKNSFEKQSELGDLKSKYLNIEILNDYRKLCLLLTRY